MIQIHTFTALAARYTGHSQYNCSSSQPGAGRLLLAAWLLQPRSRPAQPPTPYELVRPETGAQTVRRSLAGRRMGNRVMKLAAQADPFCPSSPPVGCTASTGHGGSPQPAMALTAPTADVLSQSGNHKIAVVVTSTAFSDSFTVIA